MGAASNGGRWVRKHPLMDGREALEVTGTNVVTPAARKQGTEITRTIGGPDLVGRSDPGPADHLDLSRGTSRSRCGRQTTAGCSPSSESTGHVA